VLAGGKGQRLGPLTRDRAKPAVPFGGTYRIVDFVLSNCVNTGLTRVLVPVQYRSRSLNEHIRVGWSAFFSRVKGEYIETLPPQQVEDDRWYMGTADAVSQSLFAIREEQPEAVLILSGDHIYKMDYTELLEAHEKTGAEVTIASVEVPKKEATGFGVLHVDQNNRIIKFQEKPADPEPVPDDPNICLASMGIYVFSTGALEKLLEEDRQDPKSSHDFGKDILPKLPESGKVYAYRFRDNEKGQPRYWRDVGTVDSFYSANMDLIGVTPKLDLYEEQWHVWRRATSAPPAKFVFGEDDGEGARRGQAIDSIVSAGTIVSGGTVKRSILSPHVRIHSWSKVEDSILFNGVDVGRNAVIKRAIIDKNVRIPEGFKIGVDPEEDKKRFHVSPEGVVVIGKGSVLK